MYLDFTLLKGDYSIYRLKKDEVVPDWVIESDFCSVTRTLDELSVICKTANIIVDPNIKANKHWRILKINGPLDLSLIGIIANIANLLKENKIPIFIISTYETDYILVKNHTLNKTITAFRDIGHIVLIEK